MEQAETIVKMNSRELETLMSNVGKLIKRNIMVKKTLMEYILYDSGPFPAIHIKYTSSPIVTTNNSLGIYITTIK